MDLVLLAVTWMAGGFCFAGMNERGEWVRPLPDGRQWKRLYYDSGELIRIGDVVRVAGRPEPDPPHAEDYIISRFERVRKLTHRELIAFLTTHAEDRAALDATLALDARSLCLVRAESFEIVYREGGDPRRTRIAFKLSGVSDPYFNITQKPGYPCNCLRWRAIQAQGVQIPDEFVKAFIGVGLARPFRGDDGRQVPPSPMIISLITDPHIPGEINYDNP